MKFDEKDLLKAMGLEVGDKIKFFKNGSTYVIFQEGDYIYYGSHHTNARIKKLIGKNFEKVEQKIWTEDMARESIDSEYMYYIYRHDEIGYIFGNPEHHMTDIKNKIFFTKRKYAEEYLEELKKFNEEYKRNNL